MPSIVHAHRDFVLGFTLLTVMSGQWLACTSDSSPGPQGPDAGTADVPSSDSAPESRRDDAQVARTDGAQEAGSVTWTYHDKEVRLYLPAPTGKPLPVMMYLHACNNDNVWAGDWIVSALNDVEPCAVLLPTAPPAIDFTCADWGGTYDQAERQSLIDALALLDQVIDQHGFDRKRQYLYGESMGGEGVYRLLMDYPTRFAAAGVASGYTVDKGASQMAQTPLWIFHGSNDGLAAVDNARTIYKSILAAGGTKVKFTEYDGLDHVPAIQQARGEPGMITWLLGQQRN
jgi:predicted peptidase